MSLESATSFPSFERFVAALERRLSAPLPGAAAQLVMAPRPRRRPAPGCDPDHPIPAAVLALLFPADGDPSAGIARGEPLLALTRRTDSVAAHKGQVCLPGGVVEPGESALAAALREAHEEVGLDPGAARVHGRLTPVFIPVSGFRIEPFVATSAVRPNWRLAPQEVELLIEWPLRALLDPAGRRERSVARLGAEQEPAVIPYFTHTGDEVWGATAMVLAELAALISELDVR